NEAMQHTHVAHLSGFLARDLFVVDLQHTDFFASHLVRSKLGLLRVVDSLSWSSENPTDLTLQILQITTGTATTRTVNTAPRAQLLHNFSRDVGEIRPTNLRRRRTHRQAHPTIEQVRRYKIAGTLRHECFHLVVIGVQAPVYLSAEAARLAPKTDMKKFSYSSKFRLIIWMSRKKVKEKI
ncbi:hypothetical protein KDW41_28155, partial [Burkholderia vietnamiensis]|nr:hypothetical protein [Burkholderia vietnamiensis]